MTDADTRDDYQTVTPFGVVHAYFDDDAGVELDGSSDAVAYMEHIIQTETNAFGMMMTTANIQPADYFHFCQPAGSGVLIVQPVGAAIDAALAEAKQAEGRQVMFDSVGGGYGMALAVLDGVAEDVADLRAKLGGAAGVLERLGIAEMILAARAESQSPVPDIKAAGNWWSKATQRERAEALIAAGWTGTAARPSPSAQLLMAKDWAGLKPGQKARVAAAKGFMGAAQPAAADETPAVAPTVAPEAKPEHAPAPAPKPKTADALRAAGAKLAEAGLADQMRDRLSNTARRARMAASSEAEARKREATGKTMINLADAIDAGTAPALSAFTSRAQVETLEKVLLRAMYDADRGLSYVESERRKGRPPELSDIQRARLPQPKWGTAGSSATAVVEALKGKRGAKELAMKVRYSSGPTAEIIAALRKFLTEKEVSYAVGWWNIEVAGERQRLERAGLTSDEKLREALTQYIDVRDGPKREDPIKALERKLIGQKVGFDFFPTPRHVVDRMLQRAGIKPGMRVLEPSAGSGNIADAARAAGAEVHAIEVSDQLRELLTAKGHTLKGRDFMEYAHEGPGYDAVVMNPPFSNRLDADHIKRAYSMLKPGGTLVAIAGEGVFNGSDRKAQEFRQWLEDEGAEVEKLDPNTFQDKQLLATTGANARLLSITKPEATPMLDSAADDIAALRQSLKAPGSALARLGIAERIVAARAAPVEPDYLTELFGTPEQQAETQAKFVAAQQAQADDMARIRAAIQTEKTRAAAEYDDWKGRTYKANRTQVDLHGDGPSSQDSMSIGAINESRRRKAMDALAQEMAALEKLSDALSTDSGAEQTLKNLRSLMGKAQAAVDSGNWSGQSLDEMFQSMLLEDFKFRGPGGKGNVTSNGLSAAVLKALKGAAPAEAPAVEAEPKPMTGPEALAALQAAVKGPESAPNPSPAAAPSRQYLRVAYADKDAAKALGARWDATMRQWYWPGGTELPAGLQRFRAAASPAPGARGLNPAWKQYNDLHNEGGEGFNPHPKYLNAAAAPAPASATVQPAKMIGGKVRTHDEAVRFANTALSGAQKESFMAQVRAAFPDKYPAADGGRLDSIDGGDPDDMTPDDDPPTAA